MANILRVRTVSSGWVGAPGLTTFYFQPGTAGGSTADASDCVARVRAFFDAIKALYISAQTHQVDSAVDAIDDTLGILNTTFTATPAAVVTGTGGVSLNDITSMILLQHRTSQVFVGRRVRGRSFLGPLSVNAGGSGVPLPASVATITAAATAQLLTGATASKPVVWCRPRPSHAGVSFLVTGYTGWSSWSVLRSRRD